MSWLAGKKTAAAGKRSQPSSGAPRLECITWEDHASSQDWADVEIEGPLGPTLVVSVGWVQHEDKDLVVLVNNLRVDTPKCFGQTYIVKSAIHHRAKIKFALTEKLMDRK